MHPTPTLIETVRVRAGEAPLWGLHLRRLFASCIALGVPTPRELPTPLGGADRIHRLEVGARGVETAERAVGPVTPLRLVTAREERYRPYPHKTTDRGQFERAAVEAREAGVDDALLLTRDGVVAEATVWTVCWWEDDRVAAPPLALGVLHSVARMRIAELVGEIAERTIRPAELAAHPVFLANAARGIVEVAELDGRAVPRDPGTESLARRFWGGHDGKLRA